VDESESTLAALAPKMPMAEWNLFLMSQSSVGDEFSLISKATLSGIRAVFLTGEGLIICEEKVLVSDCERFMLKTELSITD